ncbi:MAG: hypothetical protein A3I75_01110, partial [Deltaproteobacteria bacterium RIFCSPLOWO2_02_FULL_50_16]
MNKTHQNNEWYVIQTKPNKEDWVEKQLLQSNFEIFLPKIKTFCPVFGRKKSSETVYIKPFFPSYIFTRANLKDPRIFRFIKFTRGVSKILSSSSGPASLPDQAIDIIKTNINQHGVLEYKTLKIGANVRIKKGLLKDLIGILEKPVDAMGRVKVLLKMMSNDFRALLHCSEI